MRIISGAHKGRRIELLKEVGDQVRPTSDYAREAIFNLLNHRDFQKNAHPFIDQHVLDIFCGTGALGLEALSRGASEVTFIDRSREALANARYNATRMKEEERTHFFQCDATRLPPARTTFSLVFMDPPYFGQLLPKAMKSLAAGNWLAKDALLVVEHDAKEQHLLPEGFVLHDSRRYGRAAIQLVKWQGN